MADTVVENEPGTNPILVFVYGTLKRGFCNHRIIERANGRFIGRHTTLPNWNMWDLGQFPAVTANGVGQVRGEVFAVDRLEPLDNLEGYPKMYKRRLIGTPYGNAWMYYMDYTTLSKFAQSSRVIPNGLWDK